MSSVFAAIHDSLSLKYVFLLLLLLFLLHYLMVLYEFRNMPPGPRLSSLPVLGNIFSLEVNAEKLTDAFRRSVRWIDHRLSHLTQLTLMIRMIIYIISHSSVDFNWEVQLWENCRVRSLQEHHRMGIDVQTIFIHLHIWCDLWSRLMVTEQSIC